MSAKKRLPACDPCRFSKLACDHQRPTCSRCQHREQPGACVYRGQAFKKKRVTPLAELKALAPSAPEAWHTGSNRASLPLNTSSASRICQRPNPGFLGASSHSAVYTEIAEDLNGIEQAQNHVERLVPPDTSSTKPLGHLLVKGSELLSRIGLAQRIQNFKTLIQTWRAKGTQLPLGGAFLDACVRFHHTMVFSDKTDESSYIDAARQFLVNSMKPLLFDGSTTFREFCAQFCGTKARWETVGLLCTAVARATFDVPILIPLYSSQEQREQLRREMIEASDACLELSLSLDCLNDLQMVLHYENFILYSLYNGGQSFASWRRLGDVTSTLFAMGLHEKVEAGPEIPVFLAELRKTAFARIYSADKNIAIFLGRPPRISKKFCSFQIPLDLGSEALDSEGNRWGDHLRLDGRGWNTTNQINYVADTRWAALSAVIKEDILELFLGPRLGDLTERIKDIQVQADDLWNDLPEFLRIESSVRICDRTAVQRDFLLTARLHYLHITFLLQRVLFFQAKIWSQSLLDVSCEILALVVDAILLRDSLANSGTSLGWKVAAYGLPAAGVVAMEFLHQRLQPVQSYMSRPKVLQDLSVFVAHLLAGNIVSCEESNYALFQQAAMSLRALLDILLSSPVSVPPLAGDESQAMPHLWDTADLSDEWAQATTWDFDEAFWSGLAEHPMLSDTGI